MHEIVTPLGASRPGHLARMDEPIARPSWVIVGVELGHGVRLFASDTLTEGELRMVAEEPKIRVKDLALVRTMPHPRIFLTLEMEKFVMIDAVDWAAAFGALFQQWAPGGGARLAIGPG